MCLLKKEETAKNEEVKKENQTLGMALPSTTKRNSSFGQEGVSPCIANSRASPLYAAMNEQSGLGGHHFALPIDKSSEERPQRKRLKCQIHGSSPRHPFHREINF